MAKVTVVFDVDEGLLKYVNGRDDLEEAVLRELDWLRDGGMVAESMKLHENIYLKLDENREWSAMVGSERPCEGAVLFVEEKEYPAKFYYSRTDLNGSSCVELDICEDRDEILESLNWMGKCGYTPLKVWNFDANKCEDQELWEIFNAGSARRAEAAREEMDGLMGLDEAIEEASSRQGAWDLGPGAWEGIGEFANSPINKKGSKTAGRDDDLDRYF